MRRLLLTSVAICCLCGLSSGSPIAAKKPIDVRAVSDLPLGGSDAAWLMEALQVAHEDLRFAHDDLLPAHFDLAAVRDDLLAFADKDEPPKGKGKKDEAKDHGKGRKDEAKDHGKGKEKHADGEKGKPPHAGPPQKPHEKGPPDKKPVGGTPQKKPGHDDQAQHAPPHEQMLAEIRAMRELIDPGKKPHEKNDADKHDGPPHEQVLRELRDLRKALEKRHGEKKKWAVL